MAPEAGIYLRRGGAWVQLGRGSSDPTSPPVEPDPDPDPEPEPDPDPGTIPPQPSPGSRGPSGQWPTFTPAYSTPATVTTNGSTGDLQAKLNAATSGTVIQHAGDIANVTLTGGSTSWAQNVLIRPPIGQRANFTLGSTANLQASHVTIAGYRLGGNVRVRNADRAGIAWLEVRPGSSLFVDATSRDSAGLFVYEMAYIGTESYVSTGDFFQFRPVGNDLISPVFLGLYLAGPTSTGRDSLPASSKPHNDTIQTFASGGGKVRGALLRDSVIFGAGDKAFQGDISNENFVIENCTLYEPSQGQAWLPFPSGSDGAYGFHVLTGGMSVGGHIKDCDVVGSIGSAVATITDSVGWQGDLDAAATTSSGNTTASGNLAPPVLPSQMTHAYLDTVWSA